MSSPADNLRPRVADLARWARVPASLVDLPRWVLWAMEPREEGDAPTKVPYGVRGFRASSTDPATWAAYDDVLRAYAADPGRWAGIGLVLAPPFVGVDLDGAVDAATGLLLPWAAAWFPPAATYGEVSPSGRGVKFFGLAPGWPAGRRGINLKGFGPCGTGGVEVYGRGRFFAVTGQRYQDSPAAVNDVGPLVDGLYARLLAERDGRKAARRAAEAARPRANGNGHAGRAGDRWARWAAYAAKMSPSISGSNGHTAFFTAMCEGVRFDLAESELWDAAAWWNDNKTDEVWADHEIAHKVGQAERVAGHERGRRLAERRPAPVTPAGGEGAVGNDGPGGDDGPWPPDDATAARWAEVSLQLTDTGNAARFALRRGRDFRFGHARGAWLAWDGRRWAWDGSGRAVAAAKDTALSIVGDGLARRAEADAAGRAGRTDEAGHLMEKAEALLKWGHASQKRDRVAAMLALAQCELAVGVDDLDADPMALNCGNGTVDLRTGELRPHRRADYCTKLAGADYRPDAGAHPAPAFAAFLARIFRGQPDLVGYVQVALGYAATGSVREQVLLFLYGRGSNGKTTLMDVVMLALGEYATKALPDLLMDRDGAEHPCGIADLMGRRLVVCSETKEGRRFDESRLKDLAGETVLKARFMRQDPFDFAATHKIALYSNHKPVVRGTDHGFWRRMKLVPFLEQIGEREKDPALPARLAEEAGGVLAWLVAGAVRWWRDGLGDSPEVDAATRQYREEMDTIGTFLAERCDATDPAASAYARDLYAAYVAWCKAAGEKDVSQKRFGTSLAERGLDRFQCSFSNTVKWKGITVKACVNGPDGPETASN